MTRAAALGLAALAAAAACRPSADPLVTQIGDAEHGRALIAEKSCGACHTIPGVAGARGLVGPPLTGFALRSFIAGEVPNVPENLERWLRDPSAIEPTTAMPALGLDDQGARDVAAYLYELR